VPGQPEHLLRDVEDGVGDVAEVTRRGRGEVRRRRDVVVVRGLPHQDDGSAACRGRSTCDGPADRVHQGVRADRGGPLQVPPRARFARTAQGPPPFDALAPGVLLADVVPQRPGGVADGGAGPVGDDVGDLGGMGAPVPLVDELDDLLPAARLDVDVDVRRPGAPLREEPFEEQAVPDGVDGGDPERVADRRVRRRAAPLAEDAPLAAEVDDLVDDQEVAREVQVDDHVEFVLDHRVGPGLPFGLGRPVAVTGSPVGEFAQPGGLGVALGNGERREVGRDEGEVEGALVSQRGGGAHGGGVPGVPGEHLVRGPQVRRRRREPAVDVLEAGAGPHGGEDIGEGGVLGPGAVDGPGRHER